MVKSKRERRIEVYAGMNFVLDLRTLLFDVVGVKCLFCALFWRRKTRNEALNVIFV